MADQPSQSVFDIGAQQVAGVYARAFLDAAEGKGNTAAMVAELDSLVTDVLDAYPNLERVLASPFIAHEEKVGILERTLGNQASPDLLVFLKVLSKHGRLDCLRAIRRAVESQYNKMQGRVEVTLRTAGPVDDALRGEIIEKLRAILSAEPVMRVVTDASLLGGVVVRVGDTVFDGSLSTRLSRMRSQMIEQVVHKIETDRDLLV